MILVEDKIRAEAAISWKLKFNFRKNRRVTLLHNRSQLRQPRISGEGSPNNGGGATALQWSGDAALKIYKYVKETRLIRSRMKENEHTNSDLDDLRFYKFIVENCVLLEKSTILSPLILRTCLKIKFFI